MKNFICPKCKKEITRVNVISKCWQKANIDNKGKITEFESVEEVMNTLFIECPECLKDITDYIEE